MLKPPLFQEQTGSNRPAGSGLREGFGRLRSSFGFNKEVPLTLAEFNERFTRIPDLTAGLGVCQDGLPVLLNLNDASGGPLLVTGDAGCGKTTLLKILIQSAVEHDPEQRVSFVVLAAHRQAYHEIERHGLESGQCLGVCAPDEKAAEVQLRQIAGWIEKRTQRREGAAPVLVILDDLEFLAGGAGEMRNLVETILRDGADVKIWVAAALRTSDCLGMGRWTRYFRTRLIGHMPNQAARRLSLFGGLDAEKLRPQREFAARVGEKWLIFRMPDAATETNHEMEINSPAAGEDLGEQDEDWNVVV
ncbi:MAG: NACHT domain-containing protein [Anaerolineaceae bacterium]|nr:NACHT domain-containing protein [Anaerolineaceae bacterium]